MSFRIRDAEKMQRSYGVWPERLCPALGNMTNTALTSIKIPCLLSSLFLCFTCCDNQPRSLSTEKFLPGGNGELEFLIVMSSSFFCYLSWWLLLLGLVSTWHYKAVFGKPEPGSVSQIVVSVFWQVSCAPCRWSGGLLLPPSSLVVLQAKSVTDSYSSNCSFSICFRCCKSITKCRIPSSSHSLKFHGFHHVAGHAVLDIFWP